MSISVRGCGGIPRRILPRETDDRPAGLDNRRGPAALKREVRKEGFARFAARLAETPQTRDPVADLYLMARKYTVFAIDNQNLYKVMFIEHIPGAEMEWEALGHLLNGITRCIDARRFKGDPWPLALHGWAMMHGLSMIAFTGVFSHEDLLAQGPAIGFNLFVGFRTNPPPRGARSAAPSNASNAIPSSP
jgi:hypothetical protein